MDNKTAINIQTILQIGRQAIEVETAALQMLSANLDASFAQAVFHIYQNADARLVVTGIGKSAIVAQKIVSTLNSTGTPAIFMHAADAIHGDLGMIKPQDTILCLSKSGNTSEIKVLIPLVKNFGNKLVAITANAQSTLAQQADFLLLTPIKQEADPNNLAPTASTTAQMAMGDALAMALLYLKGFTAADFARFHPGGALGKQLYLRVSDLYPHNAKPLVDEMADLEAVIVEISSKLLGVVVVQNAEGALVGIITDGDLRRMLARTKHLGAVLAKDIMTRQPKTIAHDKLAVEALVAMRQQSITQLIVLKEEKYVGIVHLHDLLREGIV